MNTDFNNYYSWKINNKSEKRGGSDRLRKSTFGSKRKAIAPGADFLKKLLIRIASLKVVIPTPCKHTPLSLIKQKEDQIRGL